MPMYVIRVVFSCVDKEKSLYDEFDRRMKASGFKKTVGTVPDKKFHLPDGQYMYIENKLSSDGLRTQVEKIVLSVKPSSRPAILVSDTRTISYSGLERVKLPVKNEAFQAFMEKLGIDPEK
jgi:hypothetical protein